MRTPTLIDIPYPALPPVLDPARASLPAKEQQALDFALLLWRGKLCARHGLREMHRTWQRHRTVLGGNQR